MIDAQALVDDPRHRMSEDGTYRLSEVQARAILDLRLQRLTALGVLIDAVRHRYGSTIGVLSIPGDRRDEDIREMGRLGAAGRVLLRPSGTEHLVRVMVEAQDAELAREVAERLAAEEPGVAVDPATGEIIDPPPPPNPGEAAR